MTMKPDAAAVTPEPTGEPTGTAGNLPDPDAKAKADAAEWQRRFAGLQSKYQQEQGKWVEASAKLLDYDTQLRAVTGELEALKTTNNTFAEEKDTFQTELETTKGELERLRIITKEFPHLVPLLGEKEEDDVLPDGSGDELRAKLKTLSGRLDTLKKGAVTESVSGASPSNPPPSIKGGESLLKQAIDAMRKGDAAEYDKLYTQYVNQSSQGG